MSEMVDRVALAIMEIRDADGDSWQQALAAIAAMREPTAEMETAGDDLDDWGVPSDPGSGNASALAHWTAMIDAALK